MFGVFKAPPSPFESPTLAHRITSSPLRFLVQQIYGIELWLRGSSCTLPTEDQCIRVLCISDTHGHKPPLPDADLLIHAGDLTNQGSVAEIQDQVNWLAKLDYKYKVVIAGNHDSYFDPRSRRKEDQGKKIDWGSKKDGVHYLQHSSVTLKFPQRGGRELNIYGAPQIPACGGNDFAFQYPRGQDAWSDTIPEDIHILVTHTPPRHHLDLPSGMGCEHLLRELWDTRPRLHVCGHVHLGYGRQDLFFDKAQACYERACDREEKGIISDMINIFAWVDAVKLLAHSVSGVLWSKLWGGNDSDNRSLLVNSSVVIGSTGKTGNQPQVVEI